VLAGVDITMTYPVRSRVHRTAPEGSTTLTYDVRAAPSTRVSTPTTPPSIANAESSAHIPGCSRTPSMRWMRVAVRRPSPAMASSLGSLQVSSGAVTMHDGVGSAVAVGDAGSGAVAEGDGAAAGRRSGTAITAATTASTATAPTVPHTIQGRRALSTGSTSLPVIGPPSTNL